MRIEELLRNHGVGGGGNKGSKLNVFTQLNEPTIKEGVWIQTEHNHRKVVNDTELYFSNDWVNPSLGLVASYPAVFTNYSLVSHGQYVYAIGGLQINTAVVNCYRYDTILNVWSQIANMPSSVFGAKCVSVGQYIYVIGGREGTSEPGSRLVRRYDTITNTWTSLMLIPQAGKYNHGLVATDTKIYLIGGDAIASSTMGTSDLVIYDIATNTWSSGSSLVEVNSSPQVAIIGDFIWLMGGTNQSTRRTRVMRYSIANNTWEQVTTHLNNFQSHNYWMFSIGTNLYIPFLNNGVYKYNTLVNTWELITPTVYGNFLNSTKLNNRFYVIAGASTSNTYFSFTAKPFDENTFLLFRSHERLGSYYTQLLSSDKGIEGAFNRVLSGFNNAWLYVNGDIQEYPTYYGNGIEWVKFKN